MIRKSGYRFSEQIILNKKTQSAMTIKSNLIVL